MVRRGSTVRVRQRALENSCKSAHAASDSSATPTQRTILESSGKEESAGAESRTPVYKPEAFQTALETRNLEIGLFWQRSNYFLVLNTAIAAAFFLLLDRNTALTILLGLMGAWVSILWVCVNLGSKYWQSRWERRLEIIETDVFGGDYKLFATSRETTNWDVARSLLGRPQETRKAGRLLRLVRALGRRLRPRYNRLVLLKPSVSMTMTVLSVSFFVFWIAAVVVYAFCALLA
jgi:hypothetical protein